MVLSTLHTNDAVATVDRLLDMGVPGYLVAATLRVVVGQRLLRRICPSCRKPAQLEPAQRAWLEGVLGEQRATKLSFQAGSGCGHCNRTGYQGRIGVYEMLEPDEAMRTALRKDDSDAFALAARRVKGYRPMLASALELAAKGVTTLAEVERVAGEVEQSREVASHAPRAAAPASDGVTNAQV